MSGIDNRGDGTPPEVVCARDGAVGRILLNRPKALNSLNHGMVRLIHAALDAWEADPAVATILIEGEGGRAFCAGGDIRVLHGHGTAGRPDRSVAFWRDEYELNIRIRRYPKPFVALVDGIVMGGGMGVALHGGLMVAGDGFVFAMPEVGIGFFPDVGATYVLPRLPGSVGRYLAVTGLRIGAADAAAVGLARAAVATASLDRVRADLIAGGDPRAVIAAAPAGAGRPKLGSVEREVIAACFAHDDVAAILAALEAVAGPGKAFAAETAGVMRTRSPLSMSIALEQMRRGAALTFEEAMRIEFRIVSRMMDNPDFMEGVRAVVIDKDQAPRWQPASIDGVTPDMVARFFAPLAHELVGDGRLAP